MPDWVTAFGTLAAFAVALRLLAKELAARREVEEDRRRQQARLVVAWKTIEPPSESDPSTADSTIEYYSYPYDVQRTSEDRVDAYLLARNGSGEPIYAVRAIVVRHGSPFSSDPEAALRQPGNYIFSTWDIFPSLQTHSVLLSRRVFPNWHVIIGLSFTDSQGRRWKRLPNGTLTEVTKRPRQSRKDYYNAWIAGEMDHLDY